jgi:hypothetical protein
VVPGPDLLNNGTHNKDTHDCNNTPNPEPTPDYGNASNHYADASDVEYPQDRNTIFDSGVNAATNSKDIVGGLIKPSTYFTIGSYH